MGWIVVGEVQTQVVSRHTASELGTCFGPPFGAAGSQSPSLPQTASFFIFPPNKCDEFAINEKEAGRWRWAR